MPNPAPYIDSEGARFYKLSQAARIVEGVTATTLWRWASKGVTSFGFTLDIKHEPLIHDPRGIKPQRRTYKETRMLIPEVQVLALKEILHQAGLSQPVKWCQADLDALRVAASRHRLAVKMTSHLHTHSR